MASPERDTWFMDWGLAVYFSSILRKQLCSNPNFYYDISLLVNLGTRSNKYELSYYYWALLAKEKKKTEFICKQWHTMKQRKRSISYCQNLTNRKREKLKITTHCNSFQFRGNGESAKLYKKSQMKQVSKSDRITLYNSTWEWSQFKQTIWLLKPTISSSFAPPGTRLRMRKLMIQGCLSSNLFLYKDLSKKFSMGPRSRCFSL